jgi:hypothetical protein
MFGLLNPIWLFALGALSIPLLIHLWNVKPGRTLKVGSISLISEASRKTSRSLKLTELLLLLLRCLLLALLALLLASPWRQQNLQAQKTKGWLLIPKENFREAYAKFNPQVDSLTKAGYELHYFNKGFAKADLQTVIADITIKDAGPDKPTNYWTLINQLGRQVATTVPVYLITPNGLSHFAGNKPSTGLNLRWQTYTAADSVSRWIESAWFTNNNDVRATEGTSQPSGTSFIPYTLKSDGQASSPFVISVNNGKPTISLKNTKQAPVDIDTTTRHIALFTDRYNADAGYLKAALTAAAQFGQHKTVINEYKNANQIPARQDWIFWLSDQKVSPALLQKSSNVFLYETGKAGSMDSWINTGKGSIAAGGEQPGLYKLIATKNSTGRPVWRDGFGNPVLSMDKRGHTTVYRFYSRFDPSWNDMVWTDAYQPKRYNPTAG